MNPCRTNHRHNATIIGRTRSHCAVAGIMSKATCRTGRRAHRAQINSCHIGRGQRKAQSGIERRYRTAELCQLWIAVFFRHHGDCLESTIAATLGLCAKSHTGLEATNSRCKIAV